MTAPPTTPPRLVADAAALDGVCAEVAGQPRYALDTEFHLERSYHPRPALVQLAWAGGLALVDPLAVGLAPLAAVFDGPGLCVAHAVDQDLEVLELACGTSPRRVLDTQVAARFLGLSSPSLSRLVERFLGLDLPKGDRLTDWLARPLTDAQLAYAAGDVEHLLALADAMTARLSELGRLEWALDECAELAPRRPPVPEEAWWRLADRRRFTGASRGVAQEVAAWRERRAAAADRPRRTVLSDLALTAIALRPPRRRADLERVRGMDRRHLGGGAAEEILEAVARGRALPRADLRLPPEGGEDPTNQSLAAVAGGLVRQRAEDLDLDPSMLATRADLGDLLAGRPSRLDHGWRHDVAGRLVEDLAAGRFAVAAGPDGRLVCEERSGRPVGPRPLPDDVGQAQGPAA